MKYRARCNRRSCQARRNLNKHLDEYKRPPRCHITGCDGLMYIDWYRQRKGLKDRAPLCTDPDCNFIELNYQETGSYVPHHRVDTAKCRHYQQNLTERNTKPRSKHSPIPAKDWVPF